MKSFIGIEIANRSKNRKLLLTKWRNSIHSRPYFSEKQSVNLRDVLLRFFVSPTAPDCAGYRFTRPTGKNRKWLGVSRKAADSMLLVDIKRLRKVEILSALIIFHRLHLSHDCVGSLSGAEKRLELERGPQPFPFPACLFTGASRISHRACDFQHLKYDSGSLQREVKWCGGELVDSGSGARNAIGLHLYIVVLECDAICAKYFLLC